MNAMYIVIFVLACALTPLLTGCFIKRKMDSDRSKNAKGEATKKYYQQKIKKTNKLIKLIIIIIVILSICLIILLFIHTKGYKAIVIAQIKAKNREENFDPKLICEQEQKIPEDEAEQNYCELLNYLWFEEVGNSKDKYIEKVNEWLNGKETVTDSSIDRLEEKQKNKYDENIRKLAEIESSKMPKKSAEDGIGDGKDKLKQLTAEEYRKEYLLRMECFDICPTAAMLQQASRAALDVETVAIKDSAAWDVVTEYAGHGIQGYASLMFYVSSGESKADCCYWIAKTYKDLAENSPDEYEQYEQHCYLMAYAFAVVGEGYARVESKESHHLADLAAIRSKVESTLDLTL